jgi:hypothetical protein
MRNSFYILIILAFAACKKTPARVGPGHSTPETAYDLAEDTKISGQFEFAESEIYFRVQLPQAAMLRGELTGSRGVDARVTVFDAKKNVLTRSDDFGSSLPEEIYAVYVPAGTAYIHLVGKGGDKSDFNFFYRTFQPPADIEREPNDDMKLANAMEGLHAVGFYGPEFSTITAVKAREQDCYRKVAGNLPNQALSLKLTAVDGVQSAVTIFDAQGKELLNQVATGDGVPLEMGPLPLAESQQFTVCVSAAKPMKKLSRDYYELTLSFGELSQKKEIEPNESAKSASEITRDDMEGAIASLVDVDYFRYKNRREYPVLVKIALKTPNLQQLRLEVSGKNGTLSFEGSAPQKESADNLKLEAGEDLVFSVRNRRKINKKLFKPAPYSIHLEEIQLSDENEVEYNDSFARADNLVELAPKWGYINPLGDVDYYKVQLTEPGERTLTVESKIACKMRLEHFRGRKSLGVTSADSNIRFSGTFEKDDVLKLQCVGQKAEPIERAYRISLNESRPY